MTKSKQAVHTAASNAQDILGEVELEMISTPNDTNGAIRDTFTDEQREILIDYLESIQEIEPTTEVEPEIAALVSDLKSKAAQVEQSLQSKSKFEEKTMNNINTDDISSVFGIVNDEMISYVTKETFKTMFSSMSEEQLDRAIASVPSEISQNTSMSAEDRQVLFPAAIELASKAIIPDVTRDEKINLLVDFSLKAKAVQDAKAKTPAVTQGDIEHGFDIERARKKVDEFLTTQQQAGMAPPPPPVPNSVTESSDSSSNGSSWTLVEVLVVGAGALALGGLAYWAYRHFSGDGE